MNKLMLALLLAIFPFTFSLGQEFAVKTNALYDLTTTLNLGVEAGISKKWTMDVSGNYNPWTFADNKKWKHWMVQPEAKYWFCEKFNGHSLGFHLLAGQGNIGNVNLPFSFLGSDLRVLKDYRYQGWFVGAGLGYYYSWILGDRWNLEAGLGVGYIRFDYDKYDCPSCGSWISSDVNNYFGITKMAVNIVYIIK